MIGPVLIIRLDDGPIGPKHVALNVHEVIEPVLIIRPDDGPIGPKHVALNRLLLLINRCV